MGDARGPSDRPNVSLAFVRCCLLNSVPIGHCAQAITHHHVAMQTHHHVAITTLAARKRDFWRLCKKAEILFAPL